MKPLKKEAIRTILLFLVCLVGGCATTSQPTKDTIIGVYKVVERNCSGTPEQINTCNNITLIEFVSGSFYKVASNEIAFAVWSGNSSEALMYTAQKYKGERRLNTFPTTLTLSSNSNYVEELQFNSRTTATYKFGSPVAISELKVNLIDMAEVEKFKKNYPENEK